MGVRDRGVSLKQGQDGDKTSSRQDRYKTGTRQGQDRHKTQDEIETRW